MRDGTFSGSLDTTQCANGSNSIEMGVSPKRMRLGLLIQKAPVVAVSVSNEHAPTVATNVYGGQRYFSLNGDGGSSSTATVYYCLAKDP